MDNFGSYLHRLRESRHFSKSEMANRLLISIAMLTRLESGESQPTLDLLPPIGDLFGLTIAEIISQKENGTLGEEKNEPYSNERFAEGLKLQRFLSKKTQKELASESGVPYRTLVRFEAAEAVPKLDNLLALSKALNIDACSLFYGKEQQDNISVEPKETPKEQSEERPLKKRGKGKFRPKILIPILIFVGTSSVAVPSAIMISKMNQKAPEEGSASSVSSFEENSSSIPTSSENGTISASPGSSDNGETSLIDLPPDLEPSPNLTFELCLDRSSYAVARGGIPDDGILVFPASHNGLPVTAVKENAFYAREDLKQVYIPGSVTDIGEQAFANCANLIAVSLPDSLSHVGRFVFNECPLLQYREKDGAFYLGNRDNPYVFLARAASTSITSCLVPEGNRIIDMWAFQGCSELKSLDLPDSLTYINGDAFSGCSSLRYAAYGNALYLGNESNPYVLLAKSKNKTIAECTIHPKTKILGYAALQFCQSLTRLTIPDRVIQVGESAVSFCDSLTNLQLGTGFSRIEEDAFLGCSSLPSVALPSSIKEICFGAFARCTSLASVSIPESVLSLHPSSFEDCDSLKAIEVEEGNSRYSSKGGVVFDKEGTELLLYPKGKEEENFEVPATTTAIGNSAFSTCKTLRSVKVPSSVKTIGEWAFSQCSNLLSCELPQGLSELPMYLFHSCESLVSVNIPENVTKIDQNAFYGCKALSSIILPEKLTNIEANAFAYCVSLPSIDLPSSLTFLGWEAFYGCAKLQTVEIPAATWLMQEGVFANCASLTSFAVEEGNRSFSAVDGVLFNYDASELLIYPAKLAHEIYEIPTSVTSIVSYAFSGCNSLQSVRIPSSLSKIPDHCFSGSSSLTSIEIPESIVELGQSAFEGCSSLASVFYKGTSNQWDAITIDSGNESLLNATVYFYSENAPLTVGNYWHYEDSRPAIWA